MVCLLFLPGRPRTPGGQPRSGGHRCGSGIFCRHQRGGNHRQPTLVARRAKGVAPQAAPWVSCRKGSSGGRKACQFVARLPRRVFHQRNDCQHKLSRELVNRYGFLAVEDLHVKGMAGSRLAQSLHDAAWSSFIAKMTYKAESAARLLVKRDARGTSQQCPWGAPKKLWDRKHHCPVCGLTTTRDPAAAFKILGRRLRLRTALPAIAGRALEAPAFRHGA
jgi:IS605 OrfB family transposase